MQRASQPFNSQNAPMGRTVLAPIGENLALLVFVLLLPVQSVRHGPQPLAADAPGARLSWLTPQSAGQDSASTVDLAAVYNEVVVPPEVGPDTLFTAVECSLASLGLLHLNHRQYAVFHAPGHAADVKLLRSGDEVDLKKDPPPPSPPPGKLHFRGLAAFLELDKDDVMNNATGKAIPLRFLVKMVHEDQAVQHWSGWPRSFGYNISGYVHLPSQGVWRLLSEVHGHVVTNGKMNFGGFLGSISSSVRLLQEEKKSRSAHFGPARYRLAGTSKTWRQFRTVSLPSPEDIVKAEEESFSITAPGPTTSSGFEVPVKHSSLPWLLSSFPEPQGDNSAASNQRWKRKPFGPKRSRLKDWGQVWDSERIFSCETPDLAAVMADPLQYTAPAPTTFLASKAAEYCPPLLSEHTWWGTNEPNEKDIEWFYNEITVEKSAPFTYFMANGFFGGYFGIQEHAEGKKFAIFSVWDAGSKVEIVDWGEGVSVGRFGAEGTGANSHIEFPWMVNETIRFLVHAEVQQGPVPSGPKTTLYSGYIYYPEPGIWRLMSRLRVVPCGQHVLTDGNLMGMYSFIEVFQGLPQKPFCAEYSRERRARYGPPWYKTKGSHDFKQFPSVTLTATCNPSKGCPKQGLNYETVEQGAAQSFVMHVGGNVKNDGLPISEPRAIKPQALPFLLKDGQLPFADNSPAGPWAAGTNRPLRNFGGTAGVNEWGNGANEDLACPWYVKDCGSRFKGAYHRSP